MVLFKALIGIAGYDVTCRRRVRGPSRGQRRLWPVLEILESRLTPSAVQYTAVAAGDPTSDDAILWTRALDPAQPQALNLIAEVSTDPTFRLIDGLFLGKTDPSRDYTLKVDATGLQSGTTYYYRFLTGNGEASPVGKLKTAPDPTAFVPLHFGFSGDARGEWRCVRKSLGKEDGM